MSKGRVKKEFVVDVDGIRSLFEDYISDAIERASKRILQVIMQEIPSGKDGPGRETWREELKKSFKVKPIEINGDVVTGGVEADFDGIREFIIAKLVDVGHEPLYTKPGDNTYTYDMRLHNRDGTPHISSATKVYRMPWFEQEGVGFMDNARERAEAIVKEEIGSVFYRIDRDILMKRIKFIKK